MHFGDSNSGRTCGIDGNALSVDIQRDLVVQDHHLLKVATWESEDDKRDGLLFCS